MEVEREKEKKSLPVPLRDPKVAFLVFTPRPRGARRVIAEIINEGQPRVFKRTWSETPPMRQIPISDYADSYACSDLN